MAEPLSPEAQRLVSELLVVLKLAEGLPELHSEIVELEQYGSKDDAKSLKALRKEFTAARAKIRTTISKAKGRAA